MNRDHRHPKVLTACERSGIVRDAFTQLGLDAWSCDTEPSDTPGKHIQADVRTILHLDWTLMIAFPPCTHLTDAAAHLRHQTERGIAAIQALQLFAELFWAPIPRVCVENPKGLPSGMFMRHTQTIQPYDFGDYYRKRTLLWLRKLPLLIPTSPKPTPPQSSFTDLVRDPNTRSRTFPGIAQAMAHQWAPLA